MRPYTGGWVGRNLRGLIVDMHIGDQDPEFLSRLDPEKLADEIARANVNFVLVYAKSHWGLCLYPTKVGRMHPALKGRDFFNDMVNALHDRGIKAVCYLTVAWDELSAAEHPGWLQRDHKGTIMTNPTIRETDAAWKFLCIRSPYREIVFGHLREILEAYPVDGVFLDITSSAGGCRCRYCRDAFRRKTGRKIPLAERWKNPLFREFVTFCEDAWTGFMADSKAIVDEIRPGLPVTNNMTMAPFSWRVSQRVSEIGKHVTYGDIEDHAYTYGFGGLTFLSKLARAAVDFRHVDTFFGRYHGHWDFTIKPLAHAQVEVSAALATGASSTYIDHCWPDGTINQAVYDFLGQVFAEVKEKEEWVKVSEPVFHTALLFSERNRDMKGARNVADYLVPVNGLARALAEDHFPFDVIMDKHLTTESLSRFKVLMLTECRYLSDAEIEAVKGFVDQGGTLVSFGELARCREDFSRRDKGALEDLIGGTFAGESFPSPCYISFTHEELPGADRLTSYPIPHPRRASRLTPHGSARAIGKIIEGYPIKTQKVPWITHGLATPHKKTDNPFILINPYGKGKSIYFAGDPAGVYAERSFEEMLVLLREILRQEITWPVWLEGPSCVEVTWLRQPEKNREIIHLVNFQPELGRPIFSFQDTSPVIPLPPGLRFIGNLIANWIDTRFRPRLLKMFGPDFIPFRQPPHVIKEVLPVFDLGLHYKTDADSGFKNIYLAPEKITPETIRKNGELIIRIPRMNHHTMVVLER